jgi:hypothetical protein
MPAPIRTNQSALTAANIIPEKFIFMAARFGRVIGETEEKSAAAWFFSVLWEVCEAEMDG